MTTTRLRTGLVKRSTKPAVAAPDEVLCRTVSRSPNQLLRQSCQTAGRVPVDGNNRCGKAGNVDVIGQRREPRSKPHPGLPDPRIGAPDPTRSPRRHEARRNTEGSHRSSSSSVPQKISRLSAISPKRACSARHSSSAWGKDLIPAVLRITHYQRPGGHQVVMTIPQPRLSASRGEPRALQPALDAAKWPAQFSRMLFVHGPSCPGTPRPSRRIQSTALSRTRVPVELQEELVAVPHDDFKELAPLLC